MAREPTPEEKEKIRVGPRFRPEKPRPPWPERPAKPAPPPEAPPVAPPPTLEPVIPQPYIEPKDAKVVEKDVKDNPTVLQTPDGTKHYTPYSVMWTELGFKTDKEYHKSKMTGEASQYIGITKGVDKPVRVSRRELAKASKLVGEEQFEAFKALGVIPRGSKFMPGPGGFEGTDWSYIHPETIKTLKGELLARQARMSVKKPRVVLPPLEIRPTPPVREERPVPPVVIPEKPPIIKPPIAFRPPAYKAEVTPRLATYEANIQKAKKRQDIIVGKLKDITKGFAELTIPRPTGPAKMPKYPPGIAEKRQEFIEWQMKIATPIGNAVKTAVVFITPITKRTHKELVGYEVEVKGFNDKWRKELAEETVKASKMAEFDVDFALLENKGKVIEDKGIEIDLLAEQIDKHNSQIETYNRKWGKYSVIPADRWEEYQSDYNRLNVADAQFANAFGTYQSLSSKIDAYNTEVNSFNKKWGFLEKLGMSESEANRYESEAKKLLNTSRSLEERIERDKNILFNNGFPRESLALVWTDKLTSLSEMTIPFVYTVRRRELMDGTELAFSVATDLAAILLWYGGGKALGAAGRAVSGPLGKLKKFAKQAGQADAELHTLLRGIKLLRKDKPLFSPRVAKKVQKATAKSLDADREFLRRLERIKEITPKSIKKLEKISGLKGLAKATENANYLLTRLSQQWNKLEKMAYHPDVASPKAIAKMPKPQQIRQQSFIFANNKYLYQLNTIRRTQLALDRAMTRTGEVFRPRIREAPHAGWERVISSARKELNIARRSFNKAERIYKQQPTKINKQWLEETKADLKLAELRLDELMASMKAGEFPPEFRGYGMEWKTKAKPPDLKPDTGETIKAIQGYLDTDRTLKVAPRPWELKTQVATKTAPKVVEPKVKTVQQGRLKEIYKESKAKIKPKEVRPPKIKRKALPKKVEQLAKRYIPAAITATTIRRVGRVDPDAFVEAVAKSLEEHLQRVRGFAEASASDKVSYLAVMNLAIRAAIQAFNKAQIKQLTKTRMKDAIFEATEARLRLAPKEAVKPLVRPAVAIKVKPKIKEPILKPPPKPLIPKPKILLRIPSKKTDKQKRKIIRKSKGALAWRHGELHGKDVFHVGIYPYTREENYFTVVGKKPAGAMIIKGPGSARQSIKLLYGKEPPRKVKGDIGFFDFHITPTGPRRVDIDFIPDPKMQTRSPIQLGKRLLPISERPVGLGHGTSPRITPKIPRLRR